MTVTVTAPKPPMALAVSRAREARTLSRIGPARRAEAPWEPDPPLPKQLQRLMRRLGSIRGLLSPPQEQPPSGAAARQLRALTDGFHSEFTAALADLFRYFQSAARAGSRPHVAAALAALDEQIPTLETLLDDLGALASRYFDDTMASFVPTDPKCEVTALLDFVNFVSKTSNKFLELAWGFCDRRLDEPSPDDTKAYQGLRPTIGHRIALHHKMLGDLHWQVVRRTHDLHAADAEQAAGPAAGPAAVELIVAPLFASIRRARADALPVVQRFWERTRLVESSKVVLDLIDATLNGIETTAKFVNDLSKDFADIPFLTRESGLLYDDLVDMVKSFWGLAHAVGRFRDMTEFGTSIVDIINSENDCKRLMPLTGIAQLFEVACEYHDSSAVKDMATPILLPLIDASLRHLQELRGRELRMIWGLPKRFPRPTPEEEDIPELSDEEIAERKAEFKREYEDHSAEIERESALHTEVLQTCHRSSFRYSQKWPANSDAKPEPIPNFVDAENGAIAKSLEVIENLEKYKQRLLTSVREDSGQPDMTDEEVFLQLQFEEILQIDTIALSVQRTEREIAASRQNLLMVAVRRLDLPDARRVLQELRNPSAKRIAEVAKQREDRKGQLDVDSVKDFDKQIAGIRFSEARALAPCIDAALRDIIENTIWNYSQNVTLVEQNFVNAQQALEKEKDEKLGEADRTGQAQRDALEQKQSALKEAEDRRREAMFADIRNRIQVLIDAKQYIDANREKKRLTSLVQEDEQKAKLENQQRETVRKRVISEKERKQKEVLTQAYGRRALTLMQERDRLIVEQKRLFQSALRTQLQKFVGWVMELKGQTTRKKELFQKYEKTAKAILSENHLDELA